MRPERIVLSRGRGFNLQDISAARNGLPAQVVARPGRWGNPFAIAQVMAETALGKDEAQAECVERYRRWVSGEMPAMQSPGLPPDAAHIRAELAGKNLACWCKAGTPCHADILIDIANS